MKKLIALLPAFFLVFLVSATLANAQGKGAESFKEDLDFVGGNPCVGEPVHVTGTVHYLFHTVWDNHGGIHMSFHRNAMEGTGEGMITGDVYRATHNTRRQLLNIYCEDIEDPTTCSPTFQLPIVVVFIDEMKLMGPGPGNNLRLRWTTHITMNANGEITTSTEDFSFECR
jgi:hypothetical protein